MKITFTVVTRRVRPEMLLLVLVASLPHLRAREEEREERELEEGEEKEEVGVRTACDER